MSWFESLLGKKKPKVNTSLERNEPALAAPATEVATTAKAAEVQQEADSKEAELVLAKLRGELPASDQEHIDIPLVQEEKENAALKNERKNREQLLQYIVILKELEETVGGRTPNEVELSQPLLDGAFKKAAAAIKELNRHPQADELGIFSGLVVVVRDGNLPQLIATYERKQQESARKIKELQGDRTSQIAQEAWGKKDS